MSAERPFRLIAIRPACLSSAFAVGFLAFAMPLLFSVQAQPDPAIQASADQRNVDSPTLSDQVEALRKRIAVLQVELEQRNRAQGTYAEPARPGTPALLAKPDSMRDNRDMDPMANSAVGGMTMPPAAGGAAVQGSAPMGSASSGAMGEMGQMMNMMGQMMGAAQPAGGAAARMPDPLPGFTGAPHLYHVGADGFFLDHATHIQLTTDQQSALESLRQKALLDRADAERSIGEGEQHLFMLTGAEQPDAAAIEAQVRAIEELRVRRRLAFITAVGQAAQILTDDQRRALLTQQDRPGGPGH